MTKFLNNINLEAENDIQFKTSAGTNAGKISQTGDDLVISNAVGDILLGNGSDDVYIGDGTNTVDIRFEQNMAIFADSSSTRTLTLGGANTNLVLESPSISGSITLPTTTINSKMTFGTAAGYILFDYEPTTAGGEYTSEIPLLRVDRSGSELTILSRVSNNGAVILGNDDGVAILGGDVKGVIKDNLNLSGEEVVFAAEAGFSAYGFPSNDTSWSNRNQFRFRSDSGTATDNGLYIGDGGSTQFIDLSRNLKNIGTIGSGAITSTGAIEGSSIKKTGGASTEFLKADGSVDSNTYSTATGVANNADVTPSWVPANDPSYLTSQTSHSDVLVDGDFTGQGFMKRGSSAGSYSIDTNTYSTATGVANNADVTPSWVPASDPSYLTSETSHSDVLVDGDFGSAGFMKTDGSGNYSIDTSTYITSQRAISSTPTDNSTTTAISSDWAFDNVKTAVPTGAVFTDTVPTDFVSKANGGTFSGNVTVPDLTVGGVTYGLYHGSTEDGYYFDNINGARNLSMILKNQRADIIRYQAVDNFEYWNGSAWVADSSQEDNVKKLLDGRQDTGWNVPSTYYKFRFTTNQTSGWPLRANIGIQTSWSGSTFEGCQMLVEHYESSAWVLHVTAEFGGSGTSLNSNDNGVDDWGLMFKADSALHDGQGSSADTTRITIDFFGWSPSNSSYTVVPLQNIFITSNYAGTENTDYTNLLDHGRNLSLAGNIVMASGKTVDGVDISALPTSFFDGAYSSLSGQPSIPSISGLATETYVDTAESDAISAAATAGDARYNLVSGNLFVDSKKVMDLPSNSTQRGPFQPLAAMIRGAGTAVYGDEDFNAGSNSINVYNNQGGTGVVHTREADQTTLNEVAPNSSGYVIKVVNNGNSTSPGRGGFYQTISSSNNKTFVQVFQAKIPATYSVAHAENAQGTNNTSYFLTDTAGTGKFEWYVRVSHCGDSGSFSSGGHIYLSGGSAGDQFTWYLASSEIYNVTDAQAKKLRNLSVTNDLTVGGDITVTGDLTVNGTTTTIDTTNLNVEDNNITLNYNTGDSSSSADGAGITIQDAVSASTNATMLWDATNDRFVFSHGVVSGSTVLTGDQDISGIGTNSTNITTNATNIATNVTNIATNATNIATNVTNISTNATAISNIPAESYTAHENISAASSNLDNSGRTYIQDITLDGNGHVTAVATATETVTNTDTNKFLSGISKPANSNTMTFTVTGGTNQSFTFGSNAFNSTTIPTGNAIIDWSTSGEEAVIHSSYYTDTVYTHPSYSTTNTGSLTGANVVSQISTNSTGHVTALATRTLTLSNLGFSGNSAANCVLNASQTLTNKTIDADNNTISDLVVSNFKASAIVIESEGISSNDNDTTIPTSAAVKDYVDNNSSSANYYLDGISKTNNVLTFSVNGATNQTYEFGANAFNSTAIPSISGLATTTYVDTAEADAITAAATAAAGLYVPSAGTTTIGGTKTFTGSLILDDGVGSSPTMRFMNADDDEVSIFCNPTGKMKFQQKLVGGSNVVQMTMDENGLVVDNGLKVGTGATITTILDEDAMGSDSATALATQQSIKAYVDANVTSGGMTSWSLDSDANSAGTIGNGTIVSFDGGTGISTSRSGSAITITNSSPNVVQTTITGNAGTATALQNARNIAGVSFDGTGDISLNNNSITNGANYITDYSVTQGDVTAQQDHLSITESQISDLQSYLTSVPDNSVGLSQLAGGTDGELITYDGSGDPVHVAVGTSGHVLTSNGAGNAPTFQAASGGGSSLPSDPNIYGILVWDNTANVAKWANAGTMLSITSNGSDVNSSANNYSHPTGAGNKHIPSGGSAGKFLKYSSSGTATWATPSYTNNTNTTYQAGSLLDLDTSTSPDTFNVDLTECDAATIAAGDNIIFLDGGATGAESKGSINDVATLFAGSGLTATSGVLSVDIGNGLAFDVNTIKPVAGTNIVVDGNGIAVSTDIQTTSQRIGRSGSYGLTLDFGATDGCVFETNASTPVTVLTIGTDTNATLTGTFLATNVTSNSDERVKKDIEDIPSYKALEVIKEVKGVRYNWKEKHEDGEFPKYHKDKPKDGLKEIGFIAQDLEKILPELVEEVSSDNDFKSVNYAKMVVVLTEAMKEQQNQIEKLQKQLNKLL